MGEKREERREREEESRAVTYSRVVAAARWCWKQRRLQQRLSSRDDEEQYRYSRVRGGFLSGASSKLNLNRWCPTRTGHLLQSLRDRYESRSPNPKVARGNERLVLQR